MRVGHSCGRAMAPWSSRPSESAPRHRSFLRPEPEQLPEPSGAGAVTGRTVQGRCESWRMSRHSAQEPTMSETGRVETMFVGIDVSQERLDVGLWPAGETFQETNDRQGIATLDQAPA